MWFFIALAAGLAIGVLYAVWQYARLASGTHSFELFLVRDRYGTLWGGDSAVSIWGGPSGLSIALGLFWGLLVTNSLLFVFWLLQWV